jgi:hypothetical protein
MVSKNIMLWKIFGSQQKDGDHCKISFIADIPDPLPNINAIKLSRIKLTVHVAYIREKRGAYGILSGILEWK